MSSSEPNAGAKLADTTPEQFQKMAEADTYASFVTNKPLLQGISLAHGKTTKEMRTQLIDKLSGRK